jgi:hypothetical protein
LRFEEQNIATESKIRLEKDDVKNILDRKMNHNIGVGVGAHQRPQQHPRYHPQYHPQQHQHQRPQNTVIPQQRAMTAPAPVKITHAHPMHPPAHSMHPPSQPMHPTQVIRKNIYSGIGLGGIK